MEDYLQIAQLNDFIFCPKSIYFHNLYGRYSDRTYKQTPQIIGTINHENIDQQKYSTSKRYIQGLEVWSEQYRLCGKIDIYDTETKTLIERKTKIKTIYDGYRYQMYGQYFCLTEMGYEIEKMKFHSLSDNQNYHLKIPQEKEIEEFEALIQAIRSFDLHQKNFTQNPEKCRNCIYAPLCDSYSS